MPKERSRKGGTWGAFSYLNIMFKLSSEQVPSSFVLLEASFAVPVQPFGALGTAARVQKLALLTDWGVGVSLITRI